LQTKGEFGQKNAALHNDSGRYDGYLGAASDYCECNCLKYALCDHRPACCVPATPLRLVGIMFFPGSNFPGVYEKNIQAVACFTCASKTLRKNFGDGTMV
jgi:hypothetical protein